MRAGDRGRGAVVIRALESVAIMLAVAWCLAVVATTIRVVQVHAEVGGVASEVARRAAARGDVAFESAPQYLTWRLRRSGVAPRIRSTSIRVIRDGATLAVEVRIAAVVRFALGGHPQIGVTVVRSAPVEGTAGLP